MLQIHSKFKEIEIEVLINNNCAYTIFHCTFGFSLWHIFEINYENGNDEKLYPFHYSLYYYDTQSLEVQLWSKICSNTYPIYANLNRNLSRISLVCKDYIRDSYKTGEKLNYYQFDRVLIYKMSIT